MKNLFILLALAVAIASCSSPTNKAANRTEVQLDSISIMPNWENEGTIKLAITKTRTTTKGEKTEEVSSTSDVVLNIRRGQEPDTWDCTWKIADIKTPSIKNPVVKRFESIAKGFEYDFTLDSDGVVVQLNNWMEIQQMGYKTIDLILSELKKDPSVNNEALGQMRSMLEQMYDSQEKVETFAMQDIQLYFALGGVEMSTKDTLASYTYFMHPLLDEYMEQAVEVIYQKAFSDSTCNMQIIQYIEEDELLWATEALMDKFAPAEANREEMKKEMEGFQFDLNVVSDYNISLKTGLAETVTFTKSISVGDTERTDKTEIVKK